MPAPSSVAGGNCDQGSVDEDLHERDCSAVAAPLARSGCLAWPEPPSNRADGRPADALLRLVPPDAAVVLTVEGLRDQFRAFTSSRLFAGLQQLPAVKAWIESEKRNSSGVRATRSRPFSGAKLSEICDELLGDAVVLALRLSPDAPADPSQARGLLLFQARNKALLERLIQAVNAKQKASGELARVTDREHGRNDLPHARIRPGGFPPVRMVHHLPGRNVRILQLRKLDPVGHRPQTARSCRKPPRMPHPLVSSHQPRRSSSG